MEFQICMAFSADCRAGTAEPAFAWVQARMNQAWASAATRRSACGGMAAIFSAVSRAFWARRAAVSWSPVEAARRARSFSVATYCAITALAGVLAKGSSNANDLR